MSLSECYSKEHHIPLDRSRKYISRQGSREMLKGCPAVHKTLGECAIRITPFRGMQGCSDYMQEFRSSGGAALVSTKQIPATRIMLGLGPIGLQL